MKLVMIVVDKIKAFFKWYVEGIMRFSGPKPEVKGAEKKVEAPEKKGNESSSK